MKRKTKKTLIITLSSIGGVLVLLAGTFFIYTGIYYHADKEKIANYLKDKDVTITQVNKDLRKYTGKEEKAAFVFYPGGKVEYLAYEPLCAGLANEGITSFLYHMPFNLAVFAPNKASGLAEQYPSISTWYIGGHSLGGAMASSFLTTSSDNYCYKGLILLGAYPSKDLSKTDYHMLTMFGSNDSVMNKDKFNASMSYWPKDTEQYVIEGGVHSYFGMYGNQKGDGISNLTAEEQIDISVNKIVEFYGLENN